MANLPKSEIVEHVVPDLCAKVRLKPEVQLVEQRGINPGHDDLHGITDFVARAADTITEMARRNEVMEAEARKAIEVHKAEADAARERAAQLQEDADLLETRMDEMAAKFQGFVLDLKGKLTSCRAELELRTLEAELLREWLVYLSEEVKDRLGDAPTQLAQLAGEMHAGLCRIDTESPTVLGENLQMSKDLRPVQASYDADVGIKSREQQRLFRGNRLRRRYRAICGAESVV